MNFGRRAFLMLLPAAVISLSCQRPSPNRKVVALFVDTSASVKNHEAYRHALLKVLARLDEGDRLVLAPISASTYTEFEPKVNREIPQFNQWNGNRLVHESEVKTINREVWAAFDQMVEGPRSKRTDIVLDVLSLEIGSKR
jgi:hypothetical protein